MPYGGNPQSSASDAVRAMVGDTDPAAPLLDDNTYVFILATETNEYARASMAAQSLAGKFAQQFNKRIGDFWRDAKPIFEHYAALAKDYRRQARVRINAQPFAGGVNVADVEASRADDTIVQPRFEIGMIDRTAVKTTPPSDQFIE
jgi:hypothetical protein